jgi:hypothetical protein
MPVKLRRTAVYGNVVRGAGVMARPDSLKVSAVSELCLYSRMEIFFMDRILPGTAGGGVPIYTFKYYVDYS